ncbi:MAG: DUF1674 domain-containing protein [Thiotrichales bacterium]|nr:DUF1674 domain-containing protein [Thiotrichales bacterium]
MNNNKKHNDKPGIKEQRRDPATSPSPAQKSKEIGGPKGPEPTRYGDWERRGRCIDF